MPDTKALANFTSNIHRLGHLADVLLSAGSDLTKMLELFVSGSSNYTEIDRFRSAYMPTFHLLLEWRAVMLVTFAETYLQDILSEAAGLDPTIIKDAKLSATYDEVIQADSKDHLALELRRRWASNNFVNSAPRKWIERLRQMGAQNLDVRLADPMEQLWGIRHLVVHNAGVVTQEFARIHSVLQPVLGKQIALTSDQLTTYSDTVTRFVAETDAYFIMRLPVLSR